ncbi:MAG: histidine--tRNA ligase [Spirochaetes bacterium]|jgi:histidyl-tRNA synthetase|nr:histidine--tRNA ligase [Spirochaetota bacterium]
MNFTKPPGVEDIFPDRIDLWNFIIKTAKEVFTQYNFKEVVLPVMEFTEVFARGIGDETDIVSKEMFTFEDRGGRSLTLRPEGTASLVRAFCENGNYNRLSSSKFFYCGPMFRAEKPQRGRLRQFNQFGVEFFGDDSPFNDFEIISAMDTVTKRLGITDYKLLINSIGLDTERSAYIDELKKYYAAHQDDLCDNCKRRFETNPLRLLDCKEAQCGKLKEDVPRITSFLGEESRSHYSELKALLESAGIDYTEDHLLVRGLDYYSKTTFEFTTTELGGQNTFAAGGRYNNLVELFSGKPKPAVGFAAGIERLYLMLEDKYRPESSLDIFIIHTGSEAQKKALLTAYELRKNGISVDYDPTGGSFKAQMKKLNRERCHFMLILSEDEILGNYATLRNAETREEVKIQFDTMIESIKDILQLNNKK